MDKNFILYLPTDIPSINNLSFFDKLSTTKIGKNKNKLNEYEILIRKEDFPDENLLKMVVIYFDLIQENHLSNETQEWIDSLTSEEIYSLLTHVNDFFNIGHNFPQQISDFIALNDGKKYLLSDEYFWSLLKLTPEIYRQVQADEKLRKKGNPYSIPYRLLRDNPLNLSDYNKYKDYIITSQKYVQVEGGYLIQPKIHSRHKPYMITTSSYSEVIQKLTQMERKILSIPGVSICGGKINSYVTGKELEDNDNLFIENNLQNYQNSGGPRLYDVDIFLYNNENNSYFVEETVKQIIDVMISNIDRNLDIYHTKHSITIKVGYNRYQIIKRVYTNIQEILLGFDLDSSAIGITEIDGIIEVVYLLRYEMAVKYGINIINPKRKSFTYNYRLNKYLDRGFRPFVPGAIHKEGLYSDILYSSSVKKDTLADLIRIIYHFRNIKTIRSDYEIEFPRLLFRTSKYASLDYIMDYHGNNVEDELNSKILNEISHQSKIYKDKFDLYKIFRTSYAGNAYQLPLNKQLLSSILENTGAFDNWIKNNPGTQITGTFNPTNVDYLAPPSISSLDENEKPFDPLLIITKPVSKPIIFILKEEKDFFYLPDNIERFLVRKKIDYILYDKFQTWIKSKKIPNWVNKEWLKKKGYNPEDFTFVSDIKIPEINYYHQTQYSNPPLHIFSENENDLDPSRSPSLHSNISSRSSSYTDVTDDE